MEDSSSFKNHGRAFDNFKQEIASRYELKNLSIV